MTAINIANGAEKRPLPDERPIVPGRGVTSSFPGDDRASINNQIKTVFTSYAPLAYRLPFEILDYVELIATWNPDYSQAVENIKMLANSGHNLFVESKSKLRKRRIRERIEEKASLIQGVHGGIDGLVDKLLDQAAVFGAMCGEWVLNENLTDVIDFVDLSPKKIRYFWVPEEQRYIPHQLVNGAQAQEARDNGQEVRNGNCVRLNELTFQYFAFDAAPGSPYGTPPFLAALAPIAIQNDMVHNMAQIVKKVGLLALINVTVKSIPKKGNESDSAYETRAREYLTHYATAIEDMLRDGGMAHYDDAELEAINLAGNAAGATNIFKQNEELVFSGLKSMPSVQGRSYSTTETYAGVAYEIILRNTLKYQRAIKRMLERGYRIMTTLWGEEPDRISIQFNKNKAIQRAQEAQAEKIELDNNIRMWAEGLIDQTDVGQRHGISEPKEPRETPVTIKLIGDGTELEEEDDEEEPLVPPGAVPPDDGGGGDQDQREDDSALAGVS